MSASYQMVIDCTKLGIGEAMLVCPGPGPARSFDVEGIRIRMHSLPVTVDHADTVVA